MAGKQQETNSTPTLTPEELTAAGHKLAEGVEAFRAALAFLGVEKTHRAPENVPDTVFRAVRLSVRSLTPADQRSVLEVLMDTLDTYAKARAVAQSAPVAEQGVASC